MKVLLVIRIVHEPLPPCAAGSGDWVNRISCKPFAFLLALALAAVFAGCVGLPRVDSSQPAEYVVFVQADGVWQNSGVYARRGELIQCEAEGRWGDVDGMYGPEGNKKVYKDHLGVSAPAYGLLMMLSTETNKAFYVGSETNIAAYRSGHVMFRNNVSLSHRSSGQVRVSLKVVHDADDDGVSDFDEIHVWGTDPLNPDTDGHGFGDLNKISEMRKAREAASSGSDLNNGH